MLTCDRCPAKAVVRWMRAARVLYMCAHHAAYHADELDRQGWEARELVKSPA